MPATAEPVELSMDEALDALPAQDAPQEPTKPADAPEPKAVIEPPKPEPTAKPEPAAKPDADTGDDLHGDLPKPPAPAKPAATTPAPEGEPKTNAELRARLAVVKTEAETLRSEKATWVKESETLQRTTAAEATRTLKAELDTLRKERDEATNRIRFLDYKSSPEFTDKYQKPLQKAWESALTDIEGMTIDKEDGTTEKVTSAHLQQLIGLPAAQAAKLAAQTFGPAAAEVLAHRRAIVGLRQASDEAVAEWKTKGSEMSAAQERAQTERATRIRESFDKSVGDMRESMPEIFGKPEDAEAAVFFSKGEALVAMALKGEGLPEGLTPDQRSERVVRAQAAVAARAASFGSQRHLLVKSQTRVKELEAELASYKASGPTPAATKPTQGAMEEDSIEAGIDRIPSIG